MWDTTVAELSQVDGSNNETTSADYGSCGVAVSMHASHTRLSSEDASGDIVWSWFMLRGEAWITHASHGVSCIHLMHQQRHLMHQQRRDCFDSCASRSSLTRCASHMHLVMHLAFFLRFKGVRTLAGCVPLGRLSYP